MTATVTPLADVLLTATAHQQQYLMRLRPTTKRARTFLGERLATTSAKLVGGSWEFLNYPSTQILVQALHDPGLRVKEVA
jgi:hypothetical protein